MLYNPRLKTFLVTADAGSFNRAAEQLYVTPAAVIKQINQLESELGIQLFTRTNRGLRLTESGKKFYQDAKHIIQYSDESVMRSRNPVTGPGGTIRVATSTIITWRPVAALWPRIQAQAPELKLELVPHADTPEVLINLLHNLGKHVDIFLGTYGEPQLEYYHSAALKLCSLPLRCSVSPSNPIAQKNILTMEDLYNKNLLLSARGNLETLDRLRDHIINEQLPINIVDFDQYSLDVYNRCLNSDDILVDVDFAQEIFPLVKVLPVTWNYEIPYGMIHAITPPPHVQHFLNLVRDEIAANPISFI